MTAPIRISSSYTRVTRVLSQNTHIVSPIAQETKICEARAEEAERTTAEDCCPHTHNQFHRTCNGQGDALPKSLQDIRMNKKEYEDEKGIRGYTCRLEEIYPALIIAQ